MVGWHHWLDGHVIEQILEDSGDRWVWRAAVYRVAMSQTWLRDGTKAQRAGKLHQLRSTALHYCWRASWVPLSHAGASNFSAAQTMQETLYQVPKLGKQGLAHMFKCSPSWGLIPRNTHRGETTLGLWSPEAGCDYPPVLSPQSTLRMSILRTVMIFTGCLAGRSIYSQEQNELTIQPSMWITAGEKERNTTTLRNAATVPTSSQFLTCEARFQTSVLLQMPRSLSGTPSPSSVCLADVFVIF